MRVLFVASGNSRYGVIPFIKSQGDSLVKEGADVEFFTVSKKGFYGYLSSIIPLRKRILENNFDVIHAHYGLIGMLVLLTLTRKKRVLSVMGDDAYGSFDVNGKRILKSYFGILITKISVFFFDRVIVKSENILDSLPCKNKCLVIPNGVDFDLFKPDNNILVGNRVLFLADESIPRKNYKLFKDAIEILGLDEDNVINPFPIKHQQFPYYLNKSSVFVLTSFNEGSPNVIKEAMACNIPIVSTDVGDVKKVIGQTEGCYISSFEPYDVASKIRLAMERGRRTNGRKDIAHLESGRIARKIVNVYIEILKK